MNDLDGFLLTEQWAPPASEPAGELLGTLRLPVVTAPNQAGYVLTWREVPPDGAPYRRRGLVLALAPRPGSVWVQPDEPYPGEGFAVVVDNVTAAGCGDATRRVGTPGDYLSSAGWQQPRTLPRAIVRTDRYLSGETVTAHRYLHADRRCPAPWPSPFRGDRVRVGRPRRLDECYVFRGFLHPASVRPTIRVRYVPVCGVCLRDGRPG